jgi:hypothetical protein
VTISAGDAPSRHCAADLRRRYHTSAPVTASTEYRTGYRDGAEAASIADGDGDLT